MGCVDFAKREFVALGYDPKDKAEGPNKWIQENILELCEVFAKQGHSGMSAPYCIALFSKIALHEPTCPLRGTDDEWANVGGGIQQNKRCGHVFRENGAAYDLTGIVWRDKNGATYTSFKSRVPVTFPYTPSQKIMDEEEQ